MERDTSKLNKQHIAEALNIMDIVGTSPQTIASANTFLAQCQKQPLFALILLQIFAQHEQQSLRITSLLLVCNVIKRRWTKKSRDGVSLMSIQQKNKLKPLLIQAYKLYGMQYFKHFNQIFKYLSRIEYPHNYPQLHQFLFISMKQILKMLEQNMDIYSNLQVIAVFSTCKVVIKQFCNRRMGHNQNNFNFFALPIMQIAIQISKFIYPMITQQAYKEKTEQYCIILPMESLRKTDKIILYALQCMPKTYNLQSMVPILQLIIERCYYFAKIMFQKKFHDLDRFWEQVHKYVIGILQQIYKMQVIYPSLFMTFLRQYMLIVQQLLAKLASSRFDFNEKLLNTIISANSKPLATLLYSLSPQAYASSNYLKKNAHDTQQINQTCNLQFRSVINVSTVPEIMNLLLKIIMVRQDILETYKQISKDSLLQDADMAIVDYACEPTVYQICLNMLKELLNSIKQSSSHIVHFFLNQIMNTSLQQNRDVVVNILELGLQLPFIYSSQNLPLQDIKNIINFLFQNKQFTFFARYIRKYFCYLPPAVVHESFIILCQIVSQPLNSFITPTAICQSSLTLKQIMSQLQHEIFPIEMLRSSIDNMTKLILIPDFRQNPAMLWAILGLINRLIQCVFTQNKSTSDSICVLVVKGLAPLLCEPKHDELIVSSIGQLLVMLIYCTFDQIKRSYPPLSNIQNSISSLVNKEKQTLLVLQASFQLIARNVNNSAIQNSESTYKLWLALLQNYPSIMQQQIFNFDLQNLNQRLLQLFNNKSNKIVSENPLIFLQLVQEYILTKLLVISDADILSIVSRSLQKAEGDNRIKILGAVTSLYFAYSLLFQPIKQIITLLMTELLSIRFKVSPLINSLRTLIFLVIGESLMKYNSADFFNMFNIHFGHFSQWFPVFIYSMQFVTNKLAYKLNAAVIIKAINQIGAQAITQMLLNVTAQGDIPIDWLLRTVNIALESTQSNKVIQSYQNILRQLLTNPFHPEFALLTHRKLVLYFNQPLLVNLISQDLTPLFKIYFTALLKQLEWTSADLQQRIGQVSALEYCQLLGWQKKIQ